MKIIKELGQDSFSLAASFYKQRPKRVLACPSPGKGEENDKENNK